MPDITPKIIRSHRRTLTLHVMPDSTVVVKAPLLVPKRAIDAFVSQNSAWIEQRLRHLEKRPKLPVRTYTSGDIFYYLGNEYTLDIGNYSEIKPEGGKLLFPQAIAFRIQKELTAWYVRQAKVIITERVEYYAKQMKTSYTDLTFSDTKSQWGSCSPDNRLQFSWRLVMSSLLTINYVVVHELAHTLEKNHSAGFWSKVRFYNPTYRQQRLWLKTHGHTLAV